MDDTDSGDFNSDDTFQIDFVGPLWYSNGAAAVQESTGLTLDATNQNPPFDSATITGTSICSARVCDFRTGCSRNSVGVVGWHCRTGSLRLGIPDQRLGNMGIHRLLTNPATCWWWPSTPQDSLGAEDTVCLTRKQQCLSPPYRNPAQFGWPHRDWAFSRFGRVAYLYHVGCDHRQVLPDCLNRPPCFRDSDRMPETQAFEDTGRLVRLYCRIRSGGRFIKRTNIG